MTVSLAEWRAQVQQRRTERERHRAVLLGALADGGEVYPVQAAALLGLTGQRGISTARSRLDQLQRDGLLVSRVEPAPRSWQRRFYRLAARRSEFEGDDIG